MLENILALSVNEIIILNDLADVAKKAKKDAEIIRKAYANSFGIGEDKIEVWRDRDCNNYEYLTHSGVWQARYLHQSYDVRCTEDEIFRYYRAEYLIENGFEKETNGNCYTEAGELKFIVRYFHSFVRLAQKKLEENT